MPLLVILKGIHLVMVASSHLHYAQFSSGFFFVESEVEDAVGFVQV